ncbi:uncharacterized protein LOC133312275 [Gastrolobium bilobum]|uniref:uncharacterized protein LOC133312275 n=1 Tax=Gastrolobium bilobum TaxID=150636 RepID=UPI002AB2D18D|nr:uncharacterized protein LOC133312275 [Gastrolobium bilobum]
MTNNNDADNPLMDTIMTPLFNRPNASIVHPEMGNNHWELKSDNIRLVEREQFGGEDDEDRHRFINRFPMICDSTKHPQVSNHAVRLRLFPFALKGKALSWLEKQPAASISTWDDLSQKFFAQFFSMEKIFFNGCKPEIRMVLNGAAGGTIKTLRANETLELIERMAANENQALSSKAKRGILKLEGTDVVMAENSLLSQQVANLTSRLDKMQFSSVQAQAAAVVCEYCKEDHESNECPTLLADDPPQQPPPVQPKEPSELEKLVGQMAQHSNAFMEETRANTRNTQASIRNLENQIAKQMAERTPGTFPSNIVTNLKDDFMAITTRSGKVVAAPTKPTGNADAIGKGKEVEEEVVIPSDVETPVQKGEEEEPQITVAEKKKFELKPECESYGTLPRKV